MAISPKTEEMLRHLIILKAVADGSPELHKAILSGDDAGIQQHLLAHGQKVYNDLQASAQGGGQVASPDSPKDGKKGSTAKRAFQMASEFENAAPSQPSDEDKAASRQARVGKLFKK